MKPSPMERHTVPFFTALIVGIPLWIIWRFVPDLFPFIVAWLIAKPVYKIWKELQC